jgi:copper chaperone CopZ
MSTTTTYNVVGMTCEHCVGAVTKELSGLDGVETVSIELNVGGATPVTVVSAAPLESDDVVAAIDEAGYELAEATA